MSHDTSPAPALSRGLVILKLLEQEGSLNLETIKKLTNIPKASLLRLLKTLEDYGCVHRDLSTKKFEARLQLTPLKTENNQFSNARAEVLNDLSEALDSTSEWYEMDGNVLVLRHRNEPELLTLNVTERVGFRIEKNDKLSPIAQAARKSKKLAPSRAELFNDKAELFERTLSFSQEPDHVGVSRLAIAINDHQNKLLAVLGLAFNSQLESNTLFIKYAQDSLKHAAKNLHRENKKLLTKAFS